MCRKMAAAYDRCVSNEMLSKNMNYDDYIHEQCKTIRAKLEQEFEGAKGVTPPTGGPTSSAWTSEYDEVAKVLLT